MVTGPCMVMQLQVASCVRIGLFPNVFAVVHCQAQYKMPYVLRRKTTAHLSCAITALFQRFVPGFHSDAFFLDFYMALLPDIKEVFAYNKASGAFECRAKRPAASCACVDRKAHSQPVHGHLTVLIEGCGISESTHILWLRTSHQIAHGQLDFLAGARVRYLGHLLDQRWYMGIGGTRADGGANLRLEVGVECSTLGQLDEEHFKVGR